MKKIKICIIGLGYVGMPLSIEFSKHYKVIGFDISITRINELKKFYDRNNQINSITLKNNKNLHLTNKTKEIKECNIYIITVPTPITKNYKPDLSLIINASKQVSKILNKGDYVIYESTVYPGCVNDICVPIIEKISGFKLNKDFYCGYSPERINAGDKKNTLSKIKKIVSGSNKRSLNFIYKLYSKIIKAGVYKVSSLKIAEAAKIIENVQRDLNIALMNELSLIFNKMDIDTDEVLNAASTKWNFHKYKPGLVGGHCIGVDPYYLTEAAKKANYTPKLILAGRKLNNLMPKNSVQLLTKFLKEKNKINNFNKLNTLVLGFAFKENCPDIRNTKIYDLFLNLKKKFNKVDVYDPEVSSEEVYTSYKIKLLKKIIKKYDIVILAVPHSSVIRKIKTILNKNGTKNRIFYDLKSIFPKEYSQIRL